MMEVTQGSQSSGATTGTAGEERPGSAPGGRSGGEGGRGLRIDRIELGRLREDHGQPRRHFDATSIAELSESLRRQGQKTPIVVRPVAEHFAIIEGRRRRRAAEVAGLQGLWCVILPPTSDSDTRLHQLHEVLHSKKLHRVELALALHRLVGILRDHLDVRLEEIVSAAQRVYDVELRQ